MLSCAKTFVSALVVNPNSVSSMILHGTAPLILYFPSMLPFLGRLLSCSNLSIVQRHRQYEYDTPRLFLGRLVSCSNLSIELCHRHYEHDTPGLESMPI